MAKKPVWSPADIYIPTVVVASATAPATIQNLATGAMVNFDLLCKNLEATYGSNIQGAYSMLKRRFTKAGAEHVQGSGYYFPYYSLAMAEAIVLALAAEFSWFRKSVRDVRVTNHMGSSDITAKVVG